jgi:radical SAM protein with 4Fe4S-binding SPASM domain
MVSQAIDMLVATKDFVFDIVTCVTRRNYQKLDEIKEFLISKGVKRWRLFTVFPVGRAALDPDMRLTDKEFRGVFDFVKEVRKEGRIRVDYGCEGFLGNYEGDVRSRLFSCQAGVTVGSVMADGSIAACASIRADYNQGNIYEDDFMEVWENRYAAYRHREWMRNCECADCKYFRYCQGNGMHLRDGDGKLLLCRLKRLKDAE